MDVGNNTEPARLWCIDARNGHISTTSLPSPVVGRAIGNSAGGTMHEQNDALATPLLGRYTVRRDWDDGGGLPLLFKDFQMPARRSTSFVSRFAVTPRPNTKLCLFWGPQTVAARNCRSCVGGLSKTICKKMTTE